MLRGGRVGQRVAVGVREVRPAAERLRFVPVERAAPPKRAAEEGDARGGRRAVRPTRPGVRPRAGALVAAHGPHLRLVGGARLEVREVEGCGRRAERAAVCGPLRGALLAVLRLVAGDGRAVRGGGRPRHVERRVRLPAELSASERRRGGLAGRDIRDPEEDLDGGVVAVDGVVHLAAVELREYHARRIVFNLPVGIVRLVVDARACRDADLARGRVDDEQARAGRVARQRVAQRVIGLGVAVVVRRPRHRGADGRAGGRVLGDGAARLRGDGDVRAAGDCSAVGVAGGVVDLRRALVEQVRRQHGAAGGAGQAHAEQRRVLRGARVGQRVTVGVREERPATERLRLVPVERAAPPERAAEEGDARGGRRSVGHALTGLRPPPRAFRAGDGPDLDLVGRTLVEAGKVERRRRRAEGAAVGSPRGGLLALRGLLAVLRLVAGDGQAVGGRSRPRHVERRGGRLAELGAGECRRAGLAGCDVRHLEEDVDGGVVAVDRVVHLAAVELRDHLTVPRLRLAVVAVGRLVVEHGVLGHADLARGRVDDEEARVLGLARQRVGQRVIGQRVAVVVRGTRHGGADARPGGGVFGDLTARLCGDADGRGAGNCSAIRVAGGVADRRGALVEQGRRQRGAPGSSGQGDPEQGRVLRRG